MADPFEEWLVKQTLGAEERGPRQHVADPFEAWLVKGGYTKETANTYRVNVGLFLASGLPSTPEEIQKWVRQYARGHGKKTVSVVLASLRAYLRFTTGNPHAWVAGV